MEGRETAALDLLKYQIKSTLAQGYDAITIDKLNEVLFIAYGTVIDPEQKKELELM